ncbi:ABC transporter ATP-binding protein [Desulfobacter postgatei]|uniref:ABC transporter ATP-binding protein n=1 Tax=Desulfobacter postgatei TaxID=2293 RepID=UPI002A35F8D3|nr:ABC transporter ATP-binding protein [Desulfobacter postgatei]MDX9965037.1 ABC transporter ATP-binding protein [Desulfobacter postgatei]
MKIDIEKICKSYNGPGEKKHQILKDISFSINPGDFVIILGESGCGKTTLLNMLAGLENPTCGQIRVNGNPIVGVHPSRSMLFQQPALIPWLSVKENVAYGCKIRKDTQDLEYRVSQFLEIMGLTGSADAKPSQLSLGMAQRVCLARALVGRPQVLLLDEPFASLDTFTQAHIQEELVNLWMSESFTAVFVTHDIDEAIRLGNKIIVLAGSPAGISDIFDINVPYPRKQHDPVIKALRTNILERFKIAYLVKRSLTNEI